MIGPPTEDRYLRIDPPQLEVSKTSFLIGTVYAEETTDRSVDSCVLYSVRSTVFDLQAKREDS